MGLEEVRNNCEIDYWSFVESGVVISRLIMSLNFS